MSERVFLAGATGVIGRALVPMLVGAGYEVHAATRKADKMPQLRSQGAQPLVLDVFDTPALKAALAEIQPDVVVHQLTDLPPALPGTQPVEAIERNARIRRVGTANLVAAAIASGCQRMVAQSIAWIYAPGPQPFDESQPLDVGAPGNRAISVGGVVALETAVLSTPPLRGVVLRYGHLWGPDTGAAAPSDPVSVHVDAAARAALLAVQRRAQGIFNIVEPNDVVSANKAQSELGWSASNAA